jgi:hypothetical protein
MSKPMIDTIHIDCPHGRTTLSCLRVPHSDLDEFVGNMPFVLKPFKANDISISEDMRSATVTPKMDSSEHRR